MNTQRITLDVSKPSSPMQVVRIGQGDKKGTTIVADVYDNGAAASLSGMTARFCMRLPGGGAYVRDGSCTVSGSTVTYVVDEEHCAAAVGITSEAYFELLSGSTVVYSTSRFSVQVLRSVLDGATPAESWDSAVDDLIERGDAAVRAANEAASNANSKASAANTAASSANSAASAANTAASAANTAKTSADTAASNANAKATLANSAATAANTAKANADAATASANAAAQDALDAAEAARGAVSENLRFVIGVREFHDGTQRIALIDHGEE